MTIKTVMLYINSIHDGGAERVILQIAKTCADSGCKSILVTSFVDKNFEYPVPQGVKRISIEQDEIKQGIVARNFSRIMALRTLCKRYKPDILISFMREPNFRALIATIGLPVKNIVSVRNDPHKEYGGIIGKFLGKLIMPLADGCVFQTKEAKRWFCDSLQKRSTVILNPVREEFFLTERKPVKNRIVSCGRLEKQKNQKMMIEAFHKIYKKFSTAELHIYGSGNKKKELEVIIENLELQDRVFLQGQTDDVPKALSTAGFFIMSSDYEGLPNALMEALAMGIPSISTDCPCGGPRMLIEDGVDGILVPVGDTDKLALAMERLLRDEAFARNLGKNAKKSAEKFSADKVFKEWQDYMKRVVN